MSHIGVSRPGWNWMRGVGLWIWCGALGLGGLVSPQARAELLVETGDQVGSIPGSANLNRKTVSFALQGQFKAEECPRPQLHNPIWKCPKQLRLYSVQEVNQVVAASASETRRDLQRTQVEQSKEVQVVRAEVQALRSDLFSALSDLDSGRINSETLEQIQKWVAEMVREELARAPRGLDAR